MPSGLIAKCIGFDEPLNAHENYYQNTIILRIIIFLMTHPFIVLYVLFWTSLILYVTFSNRDEEFRWYDFGNADIDEGEHIYPIEVVGDPAIAIVSSFIQNWIFIFSWLLVILYICIINIREN